jgi:hypothetical protein
MAVVAALLAPASALAHTDQPAAGAALDQVVLATALALVAMLALGLLIARHRTGQGTLLARAAARAERVSGLPGWAALPSAIGAVALNVALLGMYWDISLHIDQGRDPGPLANPAHYLILAGLFGIFAAGCIAIGLPKGERVGPTALTITRDWQAPIGGVLVAACGAFALTGFPLDDMWHRLFGQDVTLWGPTHLMLIGGAGMTLVGQAVLLVEGMRARGLSKTRGTPALVTYLRRVGLMGGLLIGLSTFQAEFDFGVPQYRFVFQPLLIALAAGIALVAARTWIGRGGALGAAAFFLALRGFVSLAVGPVLGETTPHLPLYLGEAAAIELAALAIGSRRPLAFGALGGLLAGTVGFGTEWAWSQFAMPLPWTEALLPEAAILAAAGGLAGGLIGALLGSGLSGALPRPRVALAVFGAAMVTIGGLIGDGLSTSGPGSVQARVTLTDTRAAPNREALATVRIEPAAAAGRSAWLDVTAWQGGGFVLDRLDRVSNGVYRSTRPIPLYGDWKSIIRLHRGRGVLGVPVYMREDKAIPAAGVAATARFTRSFTTDRQILQRERKRGVPSWLWSTASTVVLLLALGFIGTLAWGIGRVSRIAPPDPRMAPPARRRIAKTPTPIGVRS